MLELTVKSTSRSTGLKPPWKPGQSGNPKGRPKNTLLIPDLLRKIGDEPIPPAYAKLLKQIYPDIGVMTHREALQRLAYHYAFKGQSWAFNYIAERTEGKPKENVESSDVNLKEFADLLMQQGVGYNAEQ